MYRIVIKTSIVFNLVLLSGCISSGRKIYVDELPPQRRTASQIETVYEITEENYILLGELYIRYNRGYDREEIMRRLKSRAAAAGADGIIINSFGMKTSKWEVVTGHSEMVDNKDYTMKVVMYRYSEE